MDAENVPWECVECEAVLLPEHIHWHGYYPVCVECYCRLIEKDIH